MSRSIVLLCLTSAISLTLSGKLPHSGQQLPESSESILFEDQDLGTKPPIKRHAPWLGFIPLVCLPPVVEVRYIVNVQSPNAKCFPPTQPSSTMSPSTTDVPELTSRFGNDSTPTTSPPRPTEPEPSRCVWAIVACCSPGSTTIRYPCFELLGCQGAFWDTNPCEPSVVQAAANTALQFYMSNMNVTETNAIEPDNL